MKANELMIGDWVRDIHTKKDMKVMRLDGDGITTRRGLYEDLHLEPIPLTEEILKANGAHWNKDFDVWTDGHHFSFAKDLHFGRVYNMDDDYHHEVMMPFKYVHELQHALRLCGLSDLADNFKITTMEK